MLPTCLLAWYDTLPMTSRPPPLWSPCLERPVSRNSVSHSPGRPRPTMQPYRDTRPKLDGRRGPATPNTTTTTLLPSCCLCADDTNTNKTFGIDATRGSDGGYTTLSWAEARPRQYSDVGAPPARDHIASQALPRWRSHEPKPTTGMAALGWMQRGPSPASLRQREF